MSPPTRAAMLLCLSVLAWAPACLAPDPDRPAPLAPLPPSAREAIRVDEMRNEASTAHAAAWTVEGTRMLRALLARSRRFEPREPLPGTSAPLSLETAVVAMRDEDTRGKATLAGELETERRRTARVEIRWILRDGSGRERASGLAVGSDERLDLRALPLPQPVDLQTGAFWDSAYGRAARTALDAIVRAVAERNG